MKLVLVDVEHLPEHKEAHAEAGAGRSDEHARLLCNLKVNDCFLFKLGRLLAELALVNKGEISRFGKDAELVRRNVSAQVDGHFGALRKPLGQPFQDLCRIQQRTFDRSKSLPILLETKVHAVVDPRKFPPSSLHVLQESWARTTRSQDILNESVRTRKPRSNRAEPLVANHDHVELAREPAHLANRLLGLDELLWKLKRGQGRKVPWRFCLGRDSDLATKVRLVQELAKSRLLSWDARSEIRGFVSYVHSRQYQGSIQPLGDETRVGQRVQLVAKTPLWSKVDHHKALHEERRFLIPFWRPSECVLQLIAHKTGCGCCRFST